MKAVICETPGRLAMIDRPRPEPALGEVLVHIRRIGVCGTDFHIFGGKHPFLEYPRVMGHELSGTVERVPEGSTLSQGQDVYIVPYLSCQRCAACRKGLTNAGQNIRVLGVHTDGGMAEYLSLPERNVVPTDGASLDDAAMIEFLAIGAHGVKRGAVTAEDRVLVVGSGPIGMAAIIFAKVRNADVTVNLVRRNTILAVSDHPDCEQPLVQTNRRVFKNRTGLNRKLTLSMSRFALKLLARGNERRVIAATHGANDFGFWFHGLPVCVANSTVARIRSK